MLKFFGISKKKKISQDKITSLFVSVLDEVILNGFVEIKDFINNNNNLESSPGLTDNDIKWFRLIVFSGNLKMLSTYFDQEQSEQLHNLLLDKMVEKIEEENDVALEQLVDYGVYISDLFKKSDNCIQAMAKAVFDKYKINKYQVDLFRRKNEANPIFFQELKNIMSHFIWNWEDYLSKHKITKDQYSLKV
ncbi:MAG: hypothetical protein H8E84_07895 [Flavobacteriales bacterium]|nr:hypothetical protein [Flavobacteriales bacterium]